MKQVKVGVVSLGCAKNLTDTETMLGYLTQAGYQIVNEEKNADILIVNTCGFIEKAKQESINTILELARQKETGRCKGIIVTGCLSQRYRDELVSEMPEIDGILGTNEYHSINEAIEKILLGKKYKGDYSLDNLLGLDIPNLRLTPKHFAYLKIGEGCDNFCSYCVIPLIRGGYKSYPLKDILNKAERMVKDGVRELNLIAQDTSKYGMDLDNTSSLEQLIRELAKIPKLDWIRVLYCYPTRITDQLIEVIKEEDKVCKYLDIPLQHCNDEILARMNRPITKQQIVDLITKLRKSIPDLVLRTSFIVGFPGETEEQFEELLEFMEKVQFERAGIFTYSQEEDTVAADMPNQIDETIKNERYHRAMELQRQISRRLNKQKVGREYEVLVEGKDNRNNSSTFWGRTREDAPEVDGRVVFKAENIELGSLVKVKIVGYDDYDLVGEMSGDEFSK